MSVILSSSVPLTTELPSRETIREQMGQYALDTHTRFTRLEQQYEKCVAILLTNQLFLESVHDLTIRNPLNIDGLGPFLSDSIWPFRLLPQESDAQDLNGNKFLNELANKIQEAHQTCSLSMQRWNRTFRSWCTSDRAVKQVFYQNGFYPDDEPLIALCSIIVGMHERTEGALTLLRDDWNSLVGDGIELGLLRRNKHLSSHLWFHPPKLSTFTPIEIDNQRDAVNLSWFKLKQIIEQIDVEHSTDSKLTELAETYYAGHFRILSRECDIQGIREDLLELNQLLIEVEQILHSLAQSDVTESVVDTLCLKFDTHQSDIKNTLNYFSTLSLGAQFQLLQYGNQITALTDFTKAIISKAIRCGVPTAVESLSRPFDKDECTLTVPPTDIATVLSTPAAQTEDKELSSKDIQRISKLLKGERIEDAEMAYKALFQVVGSKEIALQLLTANPTLVSEYATKRGVFNGYLEALTIASPLIIEKVLSGDSASVSQFSSYQKLKGFVQKYVDLEENKERIRRWESVFTDHHIDGKLAVKVIWHASYAQSRFMRVKQVTARRTLQGKLESHEVDGALGVLDALCRLGVYEVKNEAIELNASGSKKPRIREVVGEIIKARKDGHEYV